MYLSRWMTIALMTFSVVAGGDLPNVATQLRGQHLEITTVAETGFMNVMTPPGSNNFATDSSQWSGYIKDQLHWISTKAGFTYTLHLPSGQGASCSGGQKDMTKPYTSESFMYDYKCGQEDVWENRTHAYYAMYYINSERLLKNLFTIPFLSDVGLILVMPKDESKVDDFNFLLPFDNDMWIVTCITILFSSFVVFVSSSTFHRHGDDGRFVPTKSSQLNPNTLRQIVSPDSGYHKRQMENQLPHERGFLTSDNFSAHYPTFLEEASLTLSGHSVVSSRSAMAKIFAFCYCSFCLIWVTNYTANLASILADSKTTFQFTSIDEAVSRQKKICVKSGTAYADFLAKGFPEIARNLVYRENEEASTAAIYKKECEAMIIPKNTAEYYINTIACRDESGEDLGVVGESLKWGLTDMAVGVSESRPDIKETLDYWIHQLRTCVISGDSSSSCYGQRNLDDMWQEWVVRRKCVEESNLTHDQFTCRHFIVPILAVLVTGVCTIFIDVYKSRKLWRLWFSTFTDSIHVIELHKFLQENYSDYWEEDVFDHERWMEEVYSKKHTDGKWRSNLMDSVELHFTKTDANSWRLLDKTRTRLVEAQGLIYDIKQRNAVLKDKGFLLEMITLCYLTIEILTRRAILEDVESYTMKKLDEYLMESKRTTTASKETVAPEDPRSGMEDIIKKAVAEKRKAFGLSFNFGQQKRKSAVVHNLEKARDQGKFDNIETSLLRDEEETKFFNKSLKKRLKEPSFKLLGEADQGGE